jgi:outer membrane protein OmpA-like peptidoglycan-associated protein
MGEIWAQSNKTDENVYFNATVRDLQGQFVINLTNLVTPYFYNKKWYLNMYIGAGWLWYRTLLKNDDNEIQTYYGYDTFGNEQAMWSTIIWSGGATIGYKIAKHTDINLEIQAYKPVTDYLDGFYRSLSEMDIYSSVTIGINYYFGKKEQEWKYNPKEYFIKDITDDIAKQQKQLAALDSTLTEIKEEYIDSARIADNDRDSVPNFKDIEPNTPEGALVNWQGKQIPVIDTVQLYNLIKSMNIKPETVVGYASVPSDPSVQDKTAIVVAKPKKEEEKEVVTKSKKEEEKEVVAKPREELIGYAFLFGSVYFLFDLASIDISSYKEIVRVAQYMFAHPQVKIMVSGNCDKVGSDNYNYELALRRTAAVRKVLTDDFKIASDRISEESNSNKKPLSQSVDMVNRRVDFFIIQ